ncbi:hypothetical protein FQN53_000011 [Emmonsiellopsis sp. PD_33]|nr:hypothetical protein FQN53_000011 [Emmonsiellopsis sp. PD_33]
MTAALPYLRGLRKSDLVGLAELSNLQDFEDFKKTELEAALDDHLSANRASLSGEQRLADYYRRLSQPSRASPIKREPKTEPMSSGEEVKRPTRTRRQVKPKQEIEASLVTPAPRVRRPSIYANQMPDDSDESSDAASSVSKSSPAPVARTPGRPSLSFPSLPPSPAVVADAIDRRTTEVRRSVSDAWDASGLTERSNALRSCLSSVRAIEIISVLLELGGLLYTIMPFRDLTTFPAVPIGNQEFLIKYPDLFVLVGSSFWAPFFLWISTSVCLPSLFAYFFNFSLKISQQSASPGHTYGTRRTTTAANQAAARGDFDPLVFNVAKALVAYLVYAGQVNLCDVFSRHTIATVSGSVPGGLPGLLTGSAIGVLGSLYEAILRK